MRDTLLPSASAVISSPMTMDGARAALAEVVNERSPWNAFYWPTTPRRAFRGRIRETTFLRAPNTSFGRTVTIMGHFVEDPTGTTIEISIRPASLLGLFDFHATAMRAQRQLRETFRADP